MGTALAMAGFLQVYLLRIAEMNFTRVNELLKPFLFLRALGGAIFAGDSQLYVWGQISAVWRERKKLLVLLYN